MLTHPFVRGCRTKPAFAYAEHQLDFISRDHHADRVSDSEPRCPTMGSRTWPALELAMGDIDAIADQVAEQLRIDLGRHAGSDPSTTAAGGRGDRNPASEVRTYNAAHLIRAGTCA